MRTDDDLVIELNDVRTAEGNEVCDAPSRPTMINSPPSRAG